MFTFVVTRDLTNFATILHLVSKRQSAFLEVNVPIFNAKLLRSCYDSTTAESYVQSADVLQSKTEFKFTAQFTKRKQ